MANVGTPIKGKHGFGFETTADEVAKTFKDQIAGKTILMTGVSPNGLGAQAALSIAQGSPALLILAARDVSKINLTIKEISKAYPGVKTQPLAVDLSSLASIRAAAPTVLALEQPIDVLINNAGIMACPYSKTVDGLESQFGVNHVSHFLFTNLIMPKLLEAAKATGEARIVNLTSMAHQFSDIRWDDLTFDDGKTYDRWLAYGQSKTANVVFTRALVEKFASRGIKSLSLHPGGVFTPLAKHCTQDDVSSFGSETKFKSLNQGAATTVVAAFDPSLSDENGAYLEDCGISQPAPHTQAPESPQRLWELSEQLVGQKFDYGTEKKEPLSDVAVSDVTVSDVIVSDVIVSDVTERPPSFDARRSRGFRKVVDWLS